MATTRSHQLIRAKDVTTPARMRCSVTSMLNKCGVREATCYGFSPRGLLRVVVIA